VCYALVFSRHRDRSRGSVFGKVAEDTAPARGDAALDGKDAMVDWPRYWSAAAIGAALRA